MPPTFAYRNLPQLCLRAREEILRHFRPILTYYGLTEQQWRILRAVSEAGRLEPREICEICQILSPSLTGVLARMEEIGLVTRTRMTEDQRRLIVELTPKAETLVAEMQPLIVAQYRQIEKAFGSQLINDLYAVMDRLAVVAQSCEVKPVRPRAARRAK